MSTTVSGFLATALLLGAANAAGATEPLHLTGGWVGQYQHSTRLLELGNAAMKRGNDKEAEETFQAAVREQPTFWPGHYSLAGLYFDEHQWSKAIEEASLTLRYESTIAEAELLRAESYKAIGNTAAFLRDLNDLVRIRPTRSFADALNARAWFYATWLDNRLRNGGQAVKDATAACKLTNWKQANMLDTLAAASAETGDYDSAVRYEAEAIKVMSDRRRAAEYQNHMDSYRRHRPLRTPD